jgi:hypothetical protein
MGMAHQLEELRALSDDELVAMHDENAKNTVVGIDYYLNELQRRELSRQAKLRTVCRRLSDRAH